MSDPESVVRGFYAAWASPNRETLASFFADDAVWVDGPQGVHHGVDEVVGELASQLKAVGGVTVDVKTLVRDGQIVMVEEVSTSQINGTEASTVVMAVFEFYGAGKITQFREAYDLKSMLDQMKAAGFALS
jgi:limonene-1,2-epoxide hydrolase